MGFSDRLLEFRKGLHLTQAALAELVNVSQRAVAAWESGDRFPSHAVLVKLASALNVPISAFFDDAPSQVAIVYRFKIAREAAFLSQKAAAISLGVKAPSVSNWETGSSCPTLENLKAMSSLYHVSTDYLLGLTDCPDIINASAGHSDIKKEPTVCDDELRRYVISRIASLPDPAFERLRDFLAGLEAGLSSSRADGQPVSAT